MRTNKKAILGMLVAIVMSLGVMNGINNKKEVQEANLMWSYMGAFGSEMSPGENFAYGAYGTIMGSVMGAAYGAAFGGPVGFFVGAGVGL